MNPYAPAVRTLGRTLGFGWFGSRVLPAFDRPFAHRGRAGHPAWALNLDAAAEGEITVAGRTRRVRARRAAASERERYWSEAVAFWPGYEGYRRRAGRETRVYVLDPL